MNTFGEINLSSQLMNAVDRLGFEEPTQIQRDSIPLILDGRDVIGESATGSGKTLAFGAGIVEDCTHTGNVQAIVLVPTRELAEQVKDDMIKISYGKKLNILAVYGGVSINPQIDRLRDSDVVIATPGRLLDHLGRKTIDTSKVKILVLDEADRMVEMGFIEDVEKIISSCPKNRQTLLFSATMYGPAQEIAKKYMVDPETIHATKMVDPSKLKQTYYDVPGKLKKELLVHLLRKEESNLAMVFCNTRRQTDVVVRALKSAGIKAVPIHGGLNQSKRLKTIDRFHKGEFNVLVCTDVAARGLDIEGVTHIYNFDIPKEPGDYVHRIGRTARAGSKGLVINILAHRDYNNFSRLCDFHSDYDIKKEERPYLKPNPNLQNSGSRGNNNRRNNKRNNSNRRYNNKNNRRRNNRNQRNNRRNRRKSGQNRRHNKGQRRSIST